MKAKIFAQGMKDGIPIGLGYLAVSFSLGIYASSGGVTPFEGFFASLFTLASAGEYAGFSAMISKAAFFETVLLVFVANCRYLLMSCALSQRLDPEMKKIHRVFMGTFITDEIFGASIARPGYVEPEYTYGLAASSAVPWALGTALGIAVGNLLPANITSALSVALYGMFIAIIIPPARKDLKVALIVAVSFAISGLAAYIPLLRELSDGMKTVVLTVVLSSAAALLFPLKEEQ